MSPGAPVMSGDHPRIRGEHRPRFSVMLKSSGSPPHTRGALGLVCYKSPAGKDHPRIRGEHWWRPNEKQREQGSPPHTRGAHTSATPRSACPGITPAYAGSTFERNGVYWWDGDHPRIRGEHFKKGLRKRLELGSPPHTRGAPVDDLQNLDFSGITPAYAGSTCSIS